MGYKDIYQHYKTSILNGSLKPGEKLPSIRTLAAELDVAKRTVEAAFDILIGEGYLQTGGARGTWVNPDLLLPKRTRESKVNTVIDNELQHIIDLRDNDGYFRLGIPSLDEFPFKNWLLVSSKALRSMDKSDLVLPPVSGYSPLREAIAGYLNISRGLRCTPDQIFITSGYKASVALVLNTLSLKTDKVVFEEPGYFFGSKLLKRIAHNLHYNPIDKHGLDLNYFKQYNHDAKFVFITPSHHSPLAVTLSLPRRQELLDWANSKKSWIIEDDYDGEFHYTKKLIPSLKSIDHADRVIYVGTFSKTIMPSIRTSYIVLPKELVIKFTETAEITETSQPLLPQKILSHFIREGHFYKHLKKMRILYQKRRMMVLNALEKVYPGMFSVELMDGGMHIVAFLKTGSNDQKLAQSWQKHGLLVFPLSSWYAEKKKRYGLVIGYTNVKSEKEAIIALKKVEIETRKILKSE